MDFRRSIELSYQIDTFEFESQNALAHSTVYFFVNDRVNADLLHAIDAGIANLLTVSNRQSDQDRHDHF